MTWDDGCAEVSADYQLDRGAGLLTVSGRTSTAPGCTPPTVLDARGQPWSLVRRVMGAAQIPVAVLLDLLPGAGTSATTVLRLGDPTGDYIVLAPA